MQLDEFIASPAAHSHLLATDMHTPFMYRGPLPLSTRQSEAVFNDASTAERNASVRETTDPRTETADFSSRDSLRPLHDIDATARP